MDDATEQAWAETEPLAIRQEPIEDAVLTLGPGDIVLARRGRSPETQDFDVRTAALLEAAPRALHLVGQYQAEFPGPGFVSSLFAVVPLADVDAAGLRELFLGADDEDIDSVAIMLGRVVRVARECRPDGDALEEAAGLLRAICAGQGTPLVDKIINMEGL